MAWSPPPEPPRRSNKLRTVLVVVGSVLVLCCGVVGVGGYFLLNQVDSTIAPARDAVETFLADLETGKGSDAYALLCADTKRKFTREAFGLGLDSGPILQSHAITSVYVSNTNGRQSATVKAKLKYETGFVDDHVFHLVKEGEQWKICGEPY